MVFIMLILASACTRSYTAEITNDTAQALFANINRPPDSGGPEPGSLIQPGETVKMTFVEWDVPDANIQIHEMDGTTLGVTPLTERRDYRVVASEVSPLLPGFIMPVSYGATRVPIGPGPSSIWSADICRNGHQERLPLFGILADIQNDSSLTLLMKGVEPHSGYEEQGPVRVALVPPSASVQLLFDVVEEGWLLACDSAGQLRYTVSVPLADFASIVIPEELPNQPDPLPILDFTTRSSDCDPSLFRALVRGELEPLLLVLGLGVIGTWLLGKRLLRKRPPGLKPSD